MRLVPSDRWLPRGDVELSELILSSFVAVLGYPGVHLLESETTKKCRQLMLA